MKMIAAAAAATLLCAGSAFAQQAPAPLIVGAPAVTGPMLHSGTEVPLRTLRELTTEEKQLHVGDRFDMEVAEPIRLEGQVVIPQGARAVGEITEVHNKGMWGKGGRIEVRALYLVMGDRQIRLVGGQSDKGSAGGGIAVGASLIALPAGFFITGKSAHMPAGTQLLARLDEDVPVVFARAGGAAGSALAK